MKYTVDFQKLAERIYDLDATVYEILGSSLGRVYNGDRDNAVAYLVDLMESKKGANVLRAELALIGNMVKTINDKEDYPEILKEYDEIMALAKEQEDQYSRIDILDENRAHLNSMPLKTRFSAQDKKIICISRAYGSGANEIGFALSRELGLNYYDKFIFDEVMKRMEAGHTTVWEDSDLYHRNTDGRPVYTGDPFVEEGKTSFKQILEEFSRFHGLPKRDALFFSESRLITDLAERENFVIMGRYADIVLSKAEIPHVNIFISAPFEKRVERVMGLHPEMTAKQVKKMLHRIDRRHLRDYKYFTGMEWGKPSTYDLTINSSSYGIPGCVALIMEMLEGEIDYQ